MPTSGRDADVGREKVGERGKRATSEMLAASGCMHCFALSCPPDWLIMLLWFKYIWVHHHRTHLTPRNAG
jgi:hypothetical protein